ncbi:FliH/SctL family protein [Roseobacter sp. HKCCA0434]|uniref:FliH/SctL family protein n=1 Tax=Roseobacter sp. HKCCA0434 TaxID=3079297 RepID=UPI002905EA77|nr:FliH/SctL family protein [Roseobacter sp. HKCCA0434]
MTARLFRLGDLDTDGRAAPAAAETRDLRAEGYAEGFAAGAARAADAQDRLAEALSENLMEALSDASLQLAAARRTAETQACALILAACDTVLRKEAARDFAPRLTEAIRQVLDRTPEAALTLHLHPETAKRLADALPLGVPIAPDPDLAEQSARITTEFGFDTIDPDRAIDEICAILTEEELLEDDRHAHG